MEPIILHGDMSLIRFGGVVSVEIIQPGNMLRPWRYDYTLKDFFDVGLQFMAAHLSGSRIHLKTSSSKIRVIAKNLSNTSICDYDCYVNKQFVAPLDGEGYDLEFIIVGIQGKINASVSISTISNYDKVIISSDQSLFIFMSAHCYQSNRG